MSDAWTVYMILCSDGSLYTGITTNVDRRLAQHRGELPGGARFFRSRRPIKVVARFAAFGRSEALRMEARIKALPKADKERLVGGGHSFFEGLSSPLSRDSKDFSKIRRLNSETIDVRNQIQQGNLGRSSPEVEDGRQDADVGCDRSVGEDQPVHDFDLATGDQACH
ncbi:MAG: GIY-YIG nuclease family protein [Deltaproteobacteria bacterium]|nr:GIY-YIG nuclease family protein [Deltaproteobacteria bacterium]